MTKPMDSPDSEYEKDLETLAESFSSDVINEAISEIAAEEDGKIIDSNKWYRQQEHVVAEGSGNCSTAAGYESGSSETSSTAFTQKRLSASESFEKVSPIMTPRTDPPTSHMLKLSKRAGDVQDIPGYISPDSRLKILTGATTTSGRPEFSDSSDDVMHTLVNEGTQDTVHEEIPDVRKNSMSSYSSMVDDRSSKSNCSKLNSEGTSSVGSTTVFNSIAAGAFSHKHHMAPLLDVSERSLHTSQSQAEPASHTADTSYNFGSAKSTPRDAVRSSSNLKLQDSPRDLTSQLSSVTEYGTVPKKNSASHLMLSPNLAQRVSDILNQSNEPPVSALRFNRSGLSSTLSTPRDYCERKSTANTSLSEPRDDLDEHVSNVLSRSRAVLQANEDVQGGDMEDRPYLSKYISPGRDSPQASSPMPREGHQPNQLDGEERADSSTLSSDSDGINRKYMDKSSRQVLEQAADEYYRSLPKREHRKDADGQSPPNRSKNDSTGLSNASELNEELAHLTDTSQSPKHVGLSASASTQRDAAGKPRTTAVSLSEADTQSLVAKRLDRIEFMVLSALNEVPPQNKLTYREPAMAPLDTPASSHEMLVDSRELIKKTAPRSPIASLPHYQLDPPSVDLRRNKEDSFNVSISPIRKEPFTAFHKAQDVLVERLAQRSNERTPGRRLSTRSHTSLSRQSPVENLHSSPDVPRSTRSKVKDKTLSCLENIPEPRPLEIEEAGKRPSDDLLKVKATRGRSHSVSSLDSVTTVESTHPESDDAQPPQLPQHVYGSRKEPIKSAPGIYGTRTKSCEEGLTPRANSALGRAEEILHRGSELRRQIQARTDGRRDVNVSSSPDNELSPSFVRPTGERVLMRESARAPIGNESVPLDFYTPPRPARTNTSALERRERCPPRTPVEAWKEGSVEQESTPSRLRNISPPCRPLERPSPSLHPAASTRHSVSARERSPSPHSSRSPPRAILSQQPSPQARRIRPLERVHQPDNEDLRSKLSHAVTDRLSTYHILREELMKAEDSVKGRELNLAWHRISKRKVQTPNPEEDSDLASCAMTSTASSEVFGEDKMNKLKSLLNNPLGHLVSKGKETRSMKDKGGKYEKLMERIDQQRREESNLSMQSTSSIAASDDTICSRCDRKRSLKRALKADSVKHKQGNRPAEVPEQDNSKSDASSTRPVTPTSLPAPCISSSSQTEYENDDQPPAVGKTQERVKSVGVMFPSPDVRRPMSMERKGKVKEREERRVEKDAVAWFIDDKNKTDGQNTFQKSRGSDSGRGGLAWVVPCSDPRPWTKAPMQRKALSVANEPWVPNSDGLQTAAQKRAVNSICDAFNEATGRCGYMPTLQEAFRERNRRFISASRERQKRINLRSEERQMSRVHDEQRAKLFDIQPYTERQPQKKRDVKPRPAIPRDEMYDRTSRKYRVLPEVKKREKMEAIKRERVSYRLKAKLFNKKVQRHVLDQARVRDLVSCSNPLPRRG